MKENDANSASQQSAGLFAFLKEAGEFPEETGLECGEEEEGGQQQRVRWLVAGGGWLHHEIISPNFPAQPGPDGLAWPCQFYHFSFC